MDIDVLSRLMHEAYLAERNYQAVGIMNAHGLGILEAEKLDHRWKIAKTHHSIIQIIVRLYGEGKGLEGARRQASAMEFGAGSALGSLGAPAQYRAASMMDVLFGAR